VDIYATKYFLNYCWVYNSTFWIYLEASNCWGNCIWSKSIIYNCGSAILQILLFLLYFLYLLCLCWLYINIVILLIQNIICNIFIKYLVLPDNTSIHQNLMEIQIAYFNYSNYYNYNSFVIDIIDIILHLLE